MGAHEVKAITTLQERKAFLYHLLNDLKAMEDIFGTNISALKGKTPQRKSDPTEGAQICGVGS